MKKYTKNAFQRHFQHRFSLRLHMFVILLATTLSGVLISKILLWLGVANFMIRYPLSVLLAYLIFFACVKLWLLFITSKNSERGNTLDWLDFPSSSGRASGGNGGPLFRGGGGHFSGAGASGAFEGPRDTGVEAALLATPETTPADGASHGLGKGVGEAADALGGDDSGIVAVIILVILVVTILASTAYVLYDAPRILSEAAFDVFLAASLIQRTRAMSRQGWAGSIFRATWKPFAVTMAGAFICGAVLRSYFPEAARLADILWKD